MGRESGRSRQGSIFLADQQATLQTPDQLLCERMSYDG